MMKFDEVFDVVVVGGGNAGFSAATTAAQEGAQRVLLVEKAPESDAGGNTFFTAAAYRTCFDGLQDLLPYLYQANGTKGLPKDLVPKIEMDPYTKADFHADINRVTKGRADRELANTLVDNSRAAMQWLFDNGARFQLSFNRQAYEVNGKYRFWGGMVLSGLDGGKGLYKWHCETARDNGVNVYYSCPAVGLINCPVTGDVLGIKVFRDGKTRTIGATGGVVLASGGFQASSAMRTKFLGPGWDLAHVRGCQYSTGDGHKMAAQVGAKLVGNYSGCHSTAWDANSPTDAGDRHLTNQFTKSGYPLGVMVNTTGKRFVDEGFDLRNFTYAVFGKEILKQPQGIAFQVWDSDGAKLLRKEEYADDVTQNLRADTLDELADILVAKGLKDKAQFLETIAEFNAAIDDFQQENPNKKFDPAIRDGVSTQSSKTKLSPGKTNWAIPIKKGPFRAVEVTSGITFTFGGLAVDPSTGGVIAEASRKRIQGLYCTGELLGGLFWDNYPGGSGLTMGTVMGRIGGKHAAARSKRVKARAPAQQVRSQL